jgi:RHS repeat-associated protein
MNDTNNKTTSSHKHLAIWTVLVAGILGVTTNAEAYLHPQIGRFVSRDPKDSGKPGGGYHDGMNLYENVGGNPSTRLDPRGTDFIAIADRAVGVSVSPFYHYAIEYWQCDCSILVPGNPDTDGWSVAQVKKKCTRADGTGGGKMLHSVELLPQEEWDVWAWRKSDVWWSAEWVWAKKGVWIAEIKYDNKQDSNDIMPIAEGGNARLERNVKAAWARIWSAAKGYKWAEQDGFATNKKAPTFTHWPRSMYKAFQTNSNTFVRHVIKKAGLTMTEMDGWHPGNDKPSQNTDDAARGKWYFYSQHTPWTGAANAKPKPTP